MGCAVSSPNLDSEQEQVGNSELKPFPPLTRAYPSIHKMRSVLDLPPMNGGEDNKDKNNDTDPSENEKEGWVLLELKQLPCTQQSGAIEANRNEKDSSCLRSNSPSTENGVSSLFDTNSGLCHYTHTTFGWSVEYPADWVLMAKDMNTPNSNNGSNSTSVPHGFDVTLRSRRYYKNACIRISGCTSSQAREERHRRHVSEGPHVLSVCRKPYGGAPDVLHYLHEVPSEEVGTVRLEGYVFRRGEMMVEVTACVNQEGWDVSAITPAVESILSSFLLNGT